MAHGGRSKKPTAYPTATPNAVQTSGDDSGYGGDGGNNGGVDDESAAQKIFDETFASTDEGQ
jgi:hypothetical protein